MPMQWLTTAYGVGVEIDGLLGNEWGLIGLRFTG